METNVSSSSSTIGTAVAWGSALAMIFGGVVPYVPQYRDIRITDNADGFSLYVCLALLVANTLRILFWFGHPFEIPLLLQSVIMVVAMFTLIHLCVKVKNRTQIIRSHDRFFSVLCCCQSYKLTVSQIEVTSEDRSQSKSQFLTHTLVPTTTHTYSDFDSRYFWAWTDFLSYVEFFVTFTTILGVLTYVYLDNYWFVEATGFLAVFVEAMLGVPQFHRNFVSGSTEGMSKKMVLMWLTGDIFKTCYFVARSSPAQFYLCGALQVVIDTAILLQVQLYKGGKPKPSTYIS